jgi:peptidoglycan/xylan/chitin deacetylase (PgdA/CDA1 family)
MSQIAFKRRVLSSLQKAAYLGGLGSWYVRAAAVRGATILLYHSVPAAAEAPWIDPSNSITGELFEAQMRFLCQRRRVISMDQLVEELAQKRSLEAGTVLITFDDGYRDNLHVAAPILERYGLPATLYLATTAIDEGWMWIDELYAMFRHAGNTTQVLNYASLVESLSCASAGARREKLTAIHQDLRPAAAPPRLMLTWDEVREIRRRFPMIDIGAHTADHLDLSTHEAAAGEQIERSVKQIEYELGIRPKHFSFPYGRFSLASQVAVRELGMKSAVVAGASCLIDAQSDCFELARMVAPQSMTLFRFKTSGAYHGLSQAIFGRP